MSAFKDVNAPEEWVFILKDIKTKQVVKSFPNGTNDDISKWALENRISGINYYSIECPQSLERAGYELVLYEHKR